MEASQPEIVVRRINCAWKAAPCPRCGKLGKRKRTRHRTVRSISYGKILKLAITYGEYKARCRCCKSFCNSAPGVPLRAQYDNKVREAVLNRILEDSMSVEGVLKAMRRDFLLELSTGFVYDCLHRAVADLDLAEHRQKVLEVFSGSLCIDELHLGQYILLLATDPLSNIPVAFALVSKNDQDHMGRFLRNLKNWGLCPQVVITDGSNLYPALLQEIWPEAMHQLCVFHVIKDINKKILDEVREQRKKLSRRGYSGRGRRGRKTKARKAREQRAGLNNKKQAHFIYKHRYLVVKRRKNLNATDLSMLETMFEYLPALRLLRRFADNVYALFDDEQSTHQAKCQRAALVKDPDYQKYAKLVEAMGMLELAKFEKMIAFLKSPVAKRVRTNNHVERANRKLRYWEKVRYKWRRRRTLVRFVVLALDRYWKRAWAQAESDKDAGTQSTKFAAQTTELQTTQEATSGSKAA